MGLFSKKKKETSESQPSTPQSSEPTTPIKKSKLSKSEKSEKEEHHSDNTTQSNENSKPSKQEIKQESPPILRKKQITVEEFDLLVESEKRNAAALQTAVKQNSVPKFGLSHSLSSLKDNNNNFEMNVNNQQQQPPSLNAVSKVASSNSVKDYFLRKDGSPNKLKEDARNVRQKLKETKRKGPSFVAFVSFSLLGLLIIFLFARWLLFLPKSTTNLGNNFLNNNNNNLNVNNSRSTRESLSSIQNEEFVLVNKSSIFNLLLNLNGNNNNNNQHQSNKNILSFLKTQEDVQTLWSFLVSQNLTNSDVIINSHHPNSPLEDSHHHKHNNHHNQNFSEMKFTTLSQLKFFHVMNIVYFASIFVTLVPVAFSLYAMWNQPHGVIAVTLVYSLVCWLFASSLLASPGSDIVGGTLLLIPSTIAPILISIHTMKIAQSWSKIELNPEWSFRKSNNFFELLESFVRISIAPVHHQQLFKVEFFALVTNLYFYLFVSDFPLLQFPISFLLLCLFLHALSLSSKDFFISCFLYSVFISFLSIFLPFLKLGLTCSGAFVFFWSLPVFLNKLVNKFMHWESDDPLNKHNTDINERIVLFLHTVVNAFVLSLCLYFKSWPFVPGSLLGVLFVHFYGGMSGTWPSIFLFRIPYAAFLFCVSFAFQNALDQDFVNALAPLGDTELIQIIGMFLLRFSISTTAVISVFVFTCKRLGLYFKSSDFSFIHRNKDSREGFLEIIFAYSMASLIAIAANMEWESSWTIASWLSFWSAIMFALCFTHCNSFVEGLVIAFLSLRFSLISTTAFQSFVAGLSCAGVIVFGYVDAYGGKSGSSYLSVGASFLLFLASVYNRLQLLAFVSFAGLYGFLVFRILKAVQDVFLALLAISVLGAITAVGAVYYSQYSLTLIQTTTTSLLGGGISIGTVTLEETAWRTAFQLMGWFLTH